MALVLLPPSNLRITDDALMDVSSIPFSPAVVVDDILITGKRHPFSHDWQVGFDHQGQVLGHNSVQMVHCGHSAYLRGPVADRAIFHTDNAYFRAVRLKHKWHHKTLGKEGSAHFGLLWVPWSMVREEARKMKLERSS